MWIAAGRRGWPLKARARLRARSLPCRTACWAVAGYGLPNCLRITVGDEYVEYGPGSFVHIPAGVPHGVANPGPEDVIMIFGFSWPAYPPTSDA